MIEECLWNAHIYYSCILYKNIFHKKDNVMYVRDAFVVKTDITPV